MNSAALNGREILGTLSARLTHSLSNCMTALSGDLLLATLPKATDHQKAEGLKGALEAARRSAEILDEFSDLCRGLASDTEHASLGEVISNLKSWREGWTSLVSPELAQNDGFYFAGPWKWLEFSLISIAEEWCATMGTVSLELTDTRHHVRPLRDFPVTKFLLITISAPTCNAIDWEQSRRSFNNWKLTTAYELFAQLGGRPETVEGQTKVVLPLARK